MEDKTWKEVTGAAEQHGGRAFALTWFCLQGLHIPPMCTAYEIIRKNEAHFCCSEGTIVKYITVRPGRSELACSNMSPCGCLTSAQEAQAFYIYQVESISWFWRSPAKKEGVTSRSGRPSMITTIPGWLSSGQPAFLPSTGISWTFAIVPHTVVGIRDIMVNRVDTVPSS